MRAESISGSFVLRQSPLRRTCWCRDLQELIESNMTHKKYPVKFLVGSLIGVVELVHFFVDVRRFGVSLEHLLLDAVKHVYVFVGVQRF